MTETIWTSLINAPGFSQTQTGTAYASSNTLTDISPGAAVAGEALLIPQNSLSVGSQLRVVARGVVSTTGAPNLTLGLYFGGVSGTALASSTFSASANMSNNVWSLTADIRCDAVGTSGSLRTLGQIFGCTPQPVALPQTASGGGSVAVATGSSQILTLGAQWGTPSSSNSIQVLEWLVESLN